MSTKRLPPGTRAPVSGIYEQIGPRGGRTCEEADSTRGKPLPLLAAARIRAILAANARVSGSEFEVARTSQGGARKLHTRWPLHGSRFVWATK